MLGVIYTRSSRMIYDMADLSKSFHPYKMTIQTINKIF